MFIHNLNTGEIDNRIYLQVLGHDFYDDRWYVEGFLQDTMPDKG